VKCRVEKGVVFMGVAFRELPGGRSRWRLPQSRDRGLQRSTHCGYCVHGTHLLPMDHDRQDVSTPATRCAAGIMPVAVSLSNAPPTATPSSVMGSFHRQQLERFICARSLEEGLEHSGEVLGNRCYAGRAGSARTLIALSGLQFGQPIHSVGLAGDGAALKLASTLSLSLAPPRPAGGVRGPPRAATR